VIIGEAEAGLGSELDRVAHERRAGRSGSSTELRAGRAPDRDGPNSNPCRSASDTSTA
jgi:hypothetical protein